MGSEILVTGGAGYIGSHTVVKLAEAGLTPVIVDDYSNSSPKAVEILKDLTGIEIPAYPIDMTDAKALSEVFDAHQFEAVIHFAGYKAVGESVEKPLSYYQNNLVSTLNLLHLMEEHNCFKLVFSSSATVYGIPSEIPLTEGADLGAINPYGQTKLMIEHMCRDAATANESWQISLLRYFNPVGAHPSGRIGEDPKGIPNNLVPFVMQVAVGRRDKVSVFGGDWDTIDGTGVRDYIHVQDLAAGHLAALNHLKAGCEAYNLGTGQGSSVLEVIAAASKAVGQDLAHEIVDRRPGDIATSLADPSKATAELNWKTELNLDDMMRDSWSWQSANPEGYSSKDS